MEQARYASLVTEMQNISTKIIDSSTKIYTGDKDFLITELKTYISDKLKENNENIKVIGQIFRENAVRHFPIRLK